MKLLAFRGAAASAFSVVFNRAPPVGGADHPDGAERPVPDRGLGHEEAEPGGCSGQTRRQRGGLRGAPGWEI